MAILKALPSRRNPQAIQQYLLQEKSSATVLSAAPR